ncbi:MAG: AtpZ/AtpI family protein [Chloroflexi bacterium]|nr:AtpZ/AtpI family protein [Chloroflexota bacterium]
MPPWVIVALRLTGLGWYVAACIVVGIIGGVWLGKLTGQVALLVLAGTVIGSVVAFYGVYRMVLPAVYGPNRNAPPPEPPERRNTEHGGNGKS